jgi:hypothetical protein
MHEFLLSCFETNTEINTNTVGKQTLSDWKFKFSGNKHTKLRRFRITMFYIVDSFHEQMQCCNTALPLVALYTPMTSKGFGIYFKTIRDGEKNIKCKYTSKQ